MCCNNHKVEFDCMVVVAILIFFLLSLIDTSGWVKVKQFGKPAALSKKSCPSDAMFNYHETGYCDIIYLMGL